MIPKGVITKLAATERMPAQSIERDYVLAHLCADIGAVNDPRPCCWLPRERSGSP